MCLLWSDFSPRRLLGKYFSDRKDVGWKLFPHICIRFIMLYLFLYTGCRSSGVGMTSVLWTVNIPVGAGHSSRRSPTWRWRRSWRSQTGCWQHCRRKNPARLQTFWLNFNPWTFRNTNVIIDVIKNVMSMSKLYLHMETWIVSQIFSFHAQSQWITIDQSTSSKVPSPQEIWQLFRLFPPGSVPSLDPRWLPSSGDSPRTSSWEPFANPADLRIPTLIIMMRSWQFFVLHSFSKARPITRHLVHVGVKGLQWHTVHVVTPLQYFTLTYK